MACLQQSCVVSHGHMKGYVPQDRFITDLIIVLVTAEMSALMAVATCTQYFVCDKVTFIPVVASSNHVQR